MPDTTPELHVLSFPKPPAPRRKASKLLRAHLREHVTLIRAVVTVLRYRSGCGDLADVLEQGASKLARVRGVR